MEEKPGEFRITVLNHVAIRATLPIGTTRTEEIKMNSLRKKP